MTYIHHLFETQDSQERRVHRMLVSHAEPVQRDRSHCKCQTCFAKINVAIHVPVQIAVE